ncbi:P-loop containing nucleoside triphosphate hydrolases superfamily protein [Raphanus sativus]|uniref:AAA-ATPase At5g17760 n=1 Tax=Raphanus sativus TaxID=3726 RepID=A0A6J0MI46_RAPSA|nr:AAA-ATPase At5g17760 [Raphanus sativus]KAJ4910644.1 P-loop containing nucleoside triphosphate hydrolases superfamily protein [Raphanus sativus]
MLFSRDLPSPTSIFTAYASMAGYMMMIRSMAHELIPAPVQEFIYSTLRSLFFRSSSTTLTLTIDDDNMGMDNEIYLDAQTYLSTKISPDAVRLRISKGHKDKHVTLHLSNGEIIVDVYQDVELRWRFVTDGGDKSNGGGDDDGKREYFELSFDKKHRDLVINSYVPYIESKAKDINDERRILMMHSLNCLRWESVILEHPSTFETMAMEDDLKRDVIDDLDRFIRRKEFYKRVGKAWKRGYLLYGPPGTGKSSLVAAMANYLRFDVYDLQLATVMRDSDLRRLLLATRNRSILVVEDIDCAVDLPNRVEKQPVDGKNRGESQGQLTLSGLLNFIDGLWSSCGDERIIIFTTNHKDRLDPALLRPGRMDMHIYMGHCSFQGFKTLASNYLGLNDTTMPHRLYPEIQRLMDGEVITPAQVAEELMKSEDVDMALEGLVNVLEKMRLKPDESGPVMKKKESRLEMEEMRLRGDLEGSPKKNSKRIKKLVLFWT